MGLESSTPYRIRAVMTNHSAANSWDTSSRFFLTNEDARPVCSALRRLEQPPKRPAFVGGSGMILLEAMASLPVHRQASFVDISSEQVRLFRELHDALAKADCAERLRTWFGESVYPRLAAHYQQRGLCFTLPQVVTGLQELFGISFFFDNNVFAKAREASLRVEVHRLDIVDYLNQTHLEHDFIYLSNVPDYMSSARIQALFEACAGHRASLYLLATTTCPEFRNLSSIWSHSGYECHPCTHDLNASNKALGAKALQRSWNRPGQVFFLVPRLVSTE
jgi:hypothetical protein